MDLQLQGKRALVVGASKGIGLAAATALAEEGVSLVIAARSAEPLVAAASRIADAAGVSVTPITVDTGDGNSVHALVEQAHAALGGIDILVNCAASPTGAAKTADKAFPRLADTTDDDFWIDVNTKVVGYLRTARAVAPIMAAQGWGRIINVSGLGAREARSIVRTMRNVSVAALTKNLADELGASGINVTVVHPGATVTEFTRTVVEDLARKSGVSVEEAGRNLAKNAIGRMVDAREIGDVIAFLASPRSVSISGDAIAVGGGALGVVHY